MTTRETMITWKGDTLTCSRHGGSRGTPFDCRINRRRASVSDYRRVKRAAQQHVARMR